MRDLERKLWAKTAVYLSKYELREYKLEHSQAARDLGEEAVWFELIAGEFLALSTYWAEMNDLWVSKLGGDTKKPSD